MSAPSAARCSTRTSSCGRPTPTSRGGRSCSAGASPTSHGNRPPRAHVLAVDARRAARGPAAPAVPQPLPAVVQERERRGLARDLPRIAVYELLAFGHVLG